MTGGIPSGGITLFFLVSILNFIGGRSGSRTCLTHAMISMFPPLAVLITYAKSAPGVHPSYGALVAGQSAAPAFKTALVRKSDMLVPNDIAISRADIDAGLKVTFL